MTNQKYTFPWFINCFTYAKKRAQNIQDSTEQQLLYQRPEPDNWSAAECIAHLNTFGDIYYNNIQRGIKNAKTDRANSFEVFKPRIFWRGVIRIFEPPYKMKLKTISIFEPDTNNQTEHYQPFANFDELQNQFTNQLQLCQQKGINLKGTKVSNPALPFIKMTLAECYAVAEAHQRRHLWQAEQTLAQLIKTK